MARILIIEDESDTRMLMEQALIGAGHVVFLAADGKQGLKLHRADPVDLIVTDIYMEGMEGLEVINTLRKEEPRVPIIAVSGNPDFANALNLAKRLGAVTTLAKPFRPEDLRAAVAMALRPRSA